MVRFSVETDNLFGQVPSDDKENLRTPIARQMWKDSNKLLVESYQFETGTDNGGNLHLLNLDTFELLDTLELGVGRHIIGKIVLHRSRRNITPILALVDDFLELCCEKDSRLSMLQSIKLDPGIAPNTICYLTDDSWLVGCDRCTIYSVKVHFPSQLQY